MPKSVEEVRFLKDCGLLRLVGSGVACRKRAI